jgi:hypothetical protein
MATKNLISLDTAMMLTEKAQNDAQEKELSQAEYRRGRNERIAAYWKWYNGLSKEDQDQEDREQAELEQAALQAAYGDRWRYHQPHYGC